MEKDFIIIQCDKFEDRLKEQNLAEKRGWRITQSGYNGKYFCRAERTSRSLKQRNKKRRNR